MILAYESPEDIEARGSDGSVRQGQYWAAWRAYGAALAEAGLVESMNGLQPRQTALTVRLRGGERKVQDGPYVDSYADPGGYFIVDVPNVESAIEWAARCPAAAKGAVEVRPLLLKP
jgi:hypothetical protein